MNYFDFLLEDFSTTFFKFLLDNADEIPTSSLKEAYTSVQSHLSSIKACVNAVVTMSGKKSLEDLGVRVE